MMEYNYFYLYWFNFVEKLRWESLDVDGVDDQIPKPRAGHSAVSVSYKTVVRKFNNQDPCDERSRYESILS